MKKPMNTKNLALLILFLSFLSCQHRQPLPDANRKLTTQQCSPNFVFESVEVMRAEGPRVEYIIDMQKSQCHCRRYKYSLDFIGPIANSTVSHPVEYCQRLIGNLPDDYADVTKFLGDLRRDIQSAQ